jgi:hypothetical protein
MATRTLDMLTGKLADAAAGESGVIMFFPDEAALLLEQLEPREPAFEGWADIELMGHRNRIAHVREIELAHRGFLELTWTDQDTDWREIYSPSAVFSITPLESEEAADTIRAIRARDGIPF